MNERNYDFDKMIHNAIEKNELVKLLRSEGEYSVPLPTFAVVSLPVDIEKILRECFYKQYGKITGIENIFHDAMVKLILEESEDVYNSNLYFAIEYFNDCLRYEEGGIASFRIRRDEIAKLIHDEIEKKWLELKYGEKYFYFPMRLICIWNEKYKKKYGISIAPELGKMARHIHFECNETTKYYENLIKKAIENNEVIDLLRGKGSYKFILTEYTDTELIRETTTRLVCCFYMQMGRIDDIDKIFYETFVELYLGDGDASDYFWAKLYRAEHSYYEGKKVATFYISYGEITEALMSERNKFEQKFRSDIELEDGMKIKVDWKKIRKDDSEFIEKYAFKFICRYEPEDYGTEQYLRWVRGRKLRIDMKKFDKMIHNAIEKDEIIKLLRGEGEYFILRHQFDCAPISGNINSILYNCFFIQKAC